MARKKKRNTQNNPASVTPPEPVENPGQDQTPSTEPEMKPETPESTETTPETPNQPDPKVEEKPEPKKPAYVFPNKSRCPRCGALDTKSTSTQGKIQYRQCQRGHCRNRYTVRGDKI